MIVTVTPNPALDKTLLIPTFEPGGVLRASLHSSEPSGKGVNVSMALARAGVPTRALLPLGGPTGDQIRTALADIDLIAVQIAGETRTNITLVEPSGIVTKVNEPGPALLDTEVGDLLDLVHSNLRGSTWVASCGGLPPGAAQELHAEVVSAAHRHGVRCAVDTSGPGLRAALAAGPDLLKPNVHELAWLMEREMVSFGDVRQACLDLQDRGARSILVSLGGDGALLVPGNQVAPVFGRARPIRVASTVGAGDALLAGYLAADHRGSVEPAGALRHALTWAAAAVASETTGFTLTGRPPDVIVSEPPDDRVLLTEPARP